MNQIYAHIVARDVQLNTGYTNALATETPSREYNPSMTSSRKSPAANIMADQDMNECTGLFPRSTLIFPNGRRANKIKVQTIVSAPYWKVDSKILERFQYISDKNFDVSIGEYRTYVDKPIDSIIVVMSRDKLQSIFLY